MASQTEHRLGPSLSMADGAPNFTLGEYVLIRIPEAIQVDGHVDDETTVVSDLPLTSNGSSPQHFAFIRHATRNAPLNTQSDASFILEVYVVLSFTRNLAGYNALNDAARATLLPLPFLSLRHPTPEAFGDPLSFGNWSTHGDSWLGIIPVRFVMPASRPVSLLFDDWYFLYLVLNPV